MSEWQPIETAPRNGTRILCFVPNAWKERDEIHVGHCTANRIWVIGPSFGFDIGMPTHWQPLPAPPTNEPAQ